MFADTIPTTIVSREAGRRLAFAVKSPVEHRWATVIVVRWAPPRGLTRQRSPVTGASTSRPSNFAGARPRHQTEGVVSNAPSGYWSCPIEDHCEPARCRSSLPADASTDQDQCIDVGMRRSVNGAGFGRA